MLIIFPQIYAYALYAGQAQTWLANPKEAALVCRNLASAELTPDSGGQHAGSGTDGTTRIPSVIGRRQSAGDRDERLLPGNFMISLFIEAVRMANEVAGRLRPPA